MRSRPAADGPVEAEEEADSGIPLRFHESLSWRAGNKIATSELLRRLQALAKELKDADQEEIQKSSLIPPAKELAASNLLQHKDGGVKAWTACCLADILRLCAPEAPFTAPQLRDIFTLFIKSIIPALSDPSDPYNGQRLYVLQSLSQVKSIILLTDVPSANQLILQLFESCFDILSRPGDELSKNVEYNMTGILESMIDECESLPTEVVDIILAQFLRADPVATAGSNSRNKKGVAAVDTQQSTLRLNENSPAYNMAKNICNTCEDHMARFVSQYFSGIIMSASSRVVKEKPKPRVRAKASSDVDASDDDEQHGPDEESLKDLDRAHRLLRELWKSCPGILQNVIPQIEAELSAENVHLRLLATEAMGDMLAGIGAAGSPSPPVLNPAAYPPTTLETIAQERPLFSTPSAPASSQLFAYTHQAVFQSFLGRRNDKSPIIRAAWTMSIGRILSASGDFSSIGSDDEKSLTRFLSDMLIDSDEKVRVAAIQAVALFSLQDFITKLGSLGGPDDHGSILHNLSERAKDRKAAVRSLSTLLLGRLWGVAYGELANGNERVKALFGPVPSKIFEALYVNDTSIEYLVDKAIFESLLPVGYPSLKKKEKDTAQHRTGDRVDGQASGADLDTDRIRTERMLLLVKDLHQRAKVAFLARMSRPRKLADYMKAFLKCCENYNGGVMDKDEKEIKQHLGRLIEFWSKQVPESARVAEDLWRFAKAHDRRLYVLIRFCMADDSDYRKLQKSMKEIGRKLDSLSTLSSTLPETMNSLLYKVSNLFYNRSHIHAIIAFSQTDEKSLGAAAHELLKEISANNPGAFKTHAQELCRVLEEQAPTPGKATESRSFDNLKALATFARRFPEEVPKDRKFLQAMVHFTLRGSPAATAKYAVSIIMSATDKKEMYAKDILRQCTDGFAYGSDHFLTRLASLSQLMLLAYNNLEEEKDVDPVINIAINQILMRNRVASVEGKSTWQNAMDEETEAKTWAMKILVNRLRFYDDAEAIKSIATPVYQLLNTLVEYSGELSKEKDTPASQRSRLRAQAALLHLKLCTKKGFDMFLTPHAFNNLATVAQDPILEVRDMFITKVKKYLGQDRLPSRFYTVVFLLAFEPTRKLKDDSVTWARARSASLFKAKKTTMDLIFARFISLLAHHPDFETSDEELENSVKYIIFFLKAVATEDNLSLLYHIAQRVKGVQDGIDPNMSERLYYLSELAQAIISHYEEVQNWSMQAYAGKVRLPSGLFAALSSHGAAQEIATKQYLPQEFLDQVEGIVKGSMRSMKKRKSDSEIDHPAKRRTASTAGNGAPKHKALPVRKAKKTMKTTQSASHTAGLQPEAPSSERRRSGRAAGRKSYAEAEDTEDDADMERSEEDEQAGSGVGTKERKTVKTVIALPVDSDEELSDPPDSDGE